MQPVPTDVLTQPEPLLLFRKNRHALFAASFPLAALYFPLHQTAMLMPLRIALACTIVLACALAFALRVTQYLLITGDALLLHRLPVSGGDVMLYWHEVRRLVLIRNRSGRIDRIRLVTGSGQCCDLSAFQSMEVILREISLRLPEIPCEQYVAGVITLRAVLRRVTLIAVTILAGLLVVQLLWMLLT